MAQTLSNVQIEQIIKNPTLSEQEKYACLNDIFEGKCQSQRFEAQCAVASFEYEKRRNTTPVGAPLLCQALAIDQPRVNDDVGARAPVVRSDVRKKTSLEEYRRRQLPIRKRNKRKRNRNIPSQKAHNKKRRKLYRKRLPGVTLNGEKSNK